MKPERIVVSAIAAGGVLMGLALWPRPSHAQVLSGFDVFRANCAGCHDLPDPEEKQRTRAEWDQILTRMVKVRGATLTPAEHQAVLNYVDSFNREPREIHWLETPAKSHKAAFAVADAGKLPPEWVDLTLGSDDPVPWAVQVDPASKAAYVSPLKSAKDGEFPALIDNTGIVRNGSLATRVQLVSGGGSLGAGVVFGFKSPQAYFGVRLSPRDVVLYEVRNGERALLARAPMALSQKRWHAVAVELNGQNARVTVDGSPLQALSRTVPGYQGGRLGVHTQGDTVALFDQWAVTVK